VKTENSFAVSRFENRNGVSSWRVAGWLHGVRIRKNFKTKEEAAAEKAALELAALRATAGLRSATTFLNDDQLREVESAFRRLADQRRSLSVYLDFALANFRGPESDMADGYGNKKAGLEEPGLERKAKERD
jgi:hypothetical protein